MDRSHQPHLQLLFAAAAAHAGRRLHAPFQPRAGESVQPRRKLVLEHLSSRTTTRRRSRRFPSCLPRAATACRSRPSAASTDTFPQGRKVTQWQINDNLTWTRGRHTLHFGINTRRVDTSDYDLGEGIVPTVALQRPGGVHLWSRIHCSAELPGLSEGKGGRRQS